MGVQLSIGPPQRSLALASVSVLYRSWVSAWVESELVLVGVGVHVGGVGVAVHVGVGGVGGAVAWVSVYRWAWASALPCASALL